MEQPFVLGAVDTPAGPMPRVGAELAWADRLGGWGVRWGINRYDYTVFPGLYAIGKPGPEAPVLVTANYKLTFDLLRRELAGRDAWLLAVDTNGINVWCAAGKGTMGADGVAQVARDSRLDQVVSHRRLILPQLAGPGVDAREVKRLTGFEVAWGPVLAADLPPYLSNSFKATPAMRTKSFTLYERAVLAPMELVPALKLSVPLALGLMLLAGLLGPAGFWANVAGPGWFMALALVISAAGAAVLGPLLLPWLPGRAFALKGLLLGACMTVPFLVLAAAPGAAPAWAPRLAACLVMLANSSFIVMNFTGASTYTSLSGVRAEMRRAVPLQALGAALGLGLWVWWLVAA